MGYLLIFFIVTQMFSQVVNMKCQGCFAWLKIGTNYLQVLLGSTVTALCDTVIKDQTSIKPPSAACLG